MLPWPSARSVMPVQAKKAFGQHFLSDHNVCRRIVDFAAVDRADVVVEIGPGTGQLTRALLETGARVIAIEIDHSLIERLRNLPRDQSSGGSVLEVIHADILTFDWTSLSFPQPLKILGNLPYNIGTRILRQMTEIKDRFQTSTFMLQKEVAERVLASPGAESRGFLSLLLQHHFTCRKGFKVAPGSFVPPPKVQSAVFQLIPREARPQTALDRRFELLVSQAFRFRRKKLANNLKGSFSNEEIWSAFRECDLPADIRPQRLSLEQFRCLARLL